MLSRRNDVLPRSQKVISEWATHNVSRIEHDIMLPVIILVEIGSAIGLKTPYRRENRVNRWLFGTRDSVLFPYGR